MNTYELMMEDESLVTVLADNYSVKEGCLMFFVGWELTRSIQVNRWFYVQKVEAQHEDG